MINISESKEFLIKTIVEKMHALAKENQSQIERVRKSILGEKIFRSDKEKVTKGCC